MYRGLRAEDSLGCSTATGIVPSFRQELLQPAHGRDHDAGQHASEVVLGVQTVTFGAGDEAVERGGSLGGDIMPCEQPVFSAQRHPLEGALRRVARSAALLSMLRNPCRV